MERQKLKETLTELHSELETSTEPVDAETIALLRQVATDIDKVCLTESPAVEEESPVVEEKEGMLDQLLSLTEEFEESHPKLAEVIGKVASALSRIGI
ncbi:DUF4404 family protein [bacterium]|jgi:hypothetical protein|nr:DUF4404 family protein [Planctomicrobium sp.]MDB4731536.1 DUF4404 family protein [bacterium]